MASTLTDLANTLTIEEVPVKLRCVNCSRIAIDAYRLICCASTICGSCETQLPESCPQCQFTLTPEIREPHASLRRTVTVWLKTLEKKRAKQQEQPSQKAAATPIVEQPAIAANSVAELGKPKAEDTNQEGQGASAESLQDSVPEKGQDSKDTTLNELPEAIDGTVTDGTHAADSTISGEALSQGSKETPLATKNPSARGEREPEQGHGGEETAASVGGDGQGGQDGGQGGDQNQMMDGNPSFNQMNMMNGWGNQMAGMDPMKMMAMQNMQTMQGWNGYNMMGMPGMMDPSMMAQGMYGNYGQGMGMNAMNMNAMGMGYSGWDGASGMGMNQMNGMNNGHGGYGFYPNGGNMNSNRGRFARQQFPIRHQQNRFRGFGQANRGYGRDRYEEQESGYDYSQSTGMSQERGTDQRQYGQNTQEEQQALPSVESSEVVQQSGAETETATNSANADQGVLSANVQGASDSLPQVTRDDVSSNQISHDKAAQAAEFQPDGQVNLGGNEYNFDKAKAGIGGGTARVDEFGRSIAGRDVRPASVDSEPPAEAVKEDQGTTGVIEVVPSIGPNVPLGPAAQFTPRGPAVRPRAGYQAGHSRGAFEPRGSMRGRGAPFAHPAQVAAGVVGAPTGPKALREGRPNLGIRGGGIRGGRGGLMSPSSVQTRHESFPEPTPPVAPAADRRRRSSTLQQPKALRNATDQHTDNQEHTNGHGDHELSAQDDTHNDEKSSSSQRRKYRSRARSGSVESDQGHGSRHVATDRHPSHKEDRKRRHRSKSPDTRDEKLTSANEADDRINTSSSRTKSKRTSSRHRDRHRHEPKDSNPRHARRDRDRDRERSSSRTRTVPETAVPTAPREFKIQGRSKRTELDVQKEIVRDEKPTIDAHALEREARNRERMLKEQQRRGSYSIDMSNGNANGRKRSRAAVDEDGGAEDERRDRHSRRRKGKANEGESKRGRKARVYDDWDDGTLEAQERAREAERWN